MPVLSHEPQAQPARHRGDLEFRHMLAKMPAAAYTCDADGLITYFNERAMQLWGREPQLNDAVDRFCGSFKLLSTDGSPISHDACWMALALRDGKAYNEQEIVIERPDGSRCLVLAYANPFLDERGELVGAVNVLVDITDRRRAELARSQLAAIVGSSDDAIISKDLNGVIQSWNAAAQRLFGYTAEEAVGRHVSFLIPADRADEEDRILARLRAGERVYHFDTVRLRSDGQPIHVSLTISPIRDEAGRIVGASKIARDITDCKQAEERIYGLMTQLKEADSRKDEFLAMLAHELRNPLAPIRNMLQIVRLATGNGTLIEQVRAMMERQLGQMVRLVDDLLDMSRISRGKMELRKERVELASVVTSAVEDCRPLRACQPRTDRHVAARADLPGRRPDAAGPGVRQSAQQRLQVHRARRPYLADRRAAGGAAWWCTSRTPASASPPTSSPASSRCSRRSIGRWSGRRAGWASA